MGAQPAGQGAARELDLRWLSTQFELTGGQIRNAAVHAAFIAASGEGVITMDQLVNGVLGELRKVGRIVKAGELGQFARLLSS